MVKDNDLHFQQNEKGCSKLACDTKALHRSGDVIEQGQSYKALGSASKTCFFCMAVQCKQDVLFLYGSWAQTLETVSVAMLSRARRMVDLLLCSQLAPVPPISAFLEQGLTG